MSAHFGEHVTIDGYLGCAERLNRERLILSCLTELCEELRMTPLAKPCIYNAPDNAIKDPGGWSAFVVVAESHLSIHTFPRRRFLSADVYTCRSGMDVDFLSAFFKRAFLLEEVETHYLKRGLNYPAYNIIEA